MDAAKDKRDASVYRHICSDQGGSTGWITKHPESNGLRAQHQLLASAAPMQQLATCDGKPTRSQPGRWADRLQMDNIALAGRKPLRRRHAELH